VPVVIVGNKSDKKERAVSRREGSALVKELGCKFSEVSAQKYQDVENVFCDVARRLRWQRQQCGETPHDRGDPRLFRESVGGSKRNCGFCVTGCSAIRQSFTWLRSNVGPSKHMT
jgi:Ras family